MIGDTPQHKSIAYADEKLVFEPELDESALFKLDDPGGCVSSSVVDLDPLIAEFGREVLRR